MENPGRLTGSRPKGRGTFTDRQLNAWSVRPQQPVEVRHIITLGSRKVADRRAASNRLRLLGLFRESELITRFEISESDPRWPRAQALLQDYPGSVDVVSTTFTVEELRASPWLTVHPQWHHGYPMPEDDFAYRKATYDLSEYCQPCGTGPRQKRAFRMCREPRWGRRSILQLNWVFDEYFVTPDLWASVFEPRGIRCRPVLHHRTLEPLSTVLQLVVPDVFPCSPSLDTPKAGICTVCGRPKRRPHVRGFFPATPSCSQSFSLVKSAEFFGSGGSAWRMVFASQDLYQALTRVTAKGITFGAIRTGPPRAAGR